MIAQGQGNEKNPGFSALPVQKGLHPNQDVYTIIVLRGIFPPILVGI
jgi:hypothetical protein